MEHEKCVFRNFALPILAFDHLKQFQRSYKERHGVTINNNQTLAIILKQHQQFIEESVEHGWMAD